MASITVSVPSATEFSSEKWADSTMEGFPGGSDDKESACNAGDLDLIPGSGRFPWRRAWQPASVFLPGEFHGQRRLADLLSMGLQRVGHN